MTARGTHRPSTRPRRAALLAPAVGVLLALAGCKDEKTRLPFTTATTPTSPVTGPTPVYFAVSDRQGNFAAVNVFVSADGGRTTKPATPAASAPGTVVVGSLPAGASGFFLWDPIQDLGPGIHRDVTLIVSAYSHGVGFPGQTGTFTVDLSDRIDPVTAGGDERTLPVASALPDDRVWVTGGTSGGSPLSDGFVYDPRTDALTGAPGLTDPRETPGWALLRGGQVLVAGGRDGGAPSGVVDLYTPATGGAGTITAITPGLTTPRVAPAVAALPDGRGVIIGGEDAAGNGVPVLEVFTPGPGGGTVTAGLSDPQLARRGATATALLDGRILVVGGVDDADAPIGQAVVIDAALTTVTPVGSDTARAEHAAVRLPDGRVLVVGGTITLGDPTGAMTAASLFDPASDTFQAFSMRRARHRPGVAYAGGAAVVVGGANPSGAVTEAERLDLERGATFARIRGPHGTPRPDAVAVATGPGRALIVGGGEPPEAYTSVASFETRNFDALTGEGAVPDARADHTATLLTDGDVLVVGGTDGISAALDTAERFDLLSSRWTAVASLQTPRADHAAAATGGSVLVVGGRDATGVLDDAELYDPFANTWTAAGTLNVPRAGATAVTLGDGTVLVSGGVDATGTAVDAQERWSPYSRTFSVVTGLSAPRAEHRALSFSGHAVIGPGFDDTGAPLASIDLVRWNPFDVDTAAAADARAAAGLALPPSSGNIALVSGGEDASGPRDDMAFLDLRQVVLGGAPAFLTATRPLRHARAAHESVSLRSGVEVLLVGGRGAGGATLDTNEVFEFVGRTPEQGDADPTPDRRAVKARVRHTASLLSDGRVLIVGGVDERGVVISGAEVFR